VYGPFLRTVITPPFTERHPLHLAVNLRRLDLVQEAIESGIDVNTQADDGTTPLMVAASNGYDDLVKLLIKQGAKVNARQRSHRFGGGRQSALHLAVEQKRHSTCKLLLAHGASPDTLDQSRETPLNTALLNKDDEIAMTLLENGAAPNGPEKVRATPLVWAAIRRNVSMVDELLKRGADPNRRGTDGEPALIMTSSLECTRALLAHHAEVNARDREGKPALVANIRAGNIGLFRLYLEAGADVNAKDNSGETALFGAVESGKAEVVRLLCEHGAKVNETSHNGNTAIMNLALAPSIEVADVLIQFGADCNALLTPKMSVLDFVLWRLEPLKKKTHKALIQFLRLRGAKAAAELKKKK
jgi:uncharacterized protein